jgi:hypothetical protein
MTDQNILGLSRGHVPEVQAYQMLGEPRVGGRSMLRVIGRFTSYLEPTGLAAARINVLALRVVIIPALAMETVFCS